MLLVLIGPALLQLSPAQVAVLQAGLHLNQPGRERAELVHRSDGADSLQVVGEGLDQLMGSF